jgi:stage III sporulation protein AE
MTITCSAKEYTFDVTNENFYAEKEISDFKNSIPSDIKDKLVNLSPEEADEAAKRYDLNFFVREITSAVKNNLASNISLFATITSMVIISGVFERLSVSLNVNDLNKTFKFCSTLAIVIATYTSQKSSFTIAVNLLKELTSIMTVITPFMEAIYISGGNTSLAAVNGTSIALTITIVEVIYSKILLPATAITLILCSVSAATDNKGLAYLSKSIRTLLTAGIVAIMALTSIALSLQSGLAASTDRFSQRAIRFALGSYIPLIGGYISESLSALTGSLSMIKQFAGTTGIVVLLLLILPPMISLIMTRKYIQTVASTVLKIPVYKGRWVK